MKLVIGLCIAAFDPERLAAGNKLVEELRPQCDRLGVNLFVQREMERRGSLAPWLEMFDTASVLPATHYTYLPDDAILVPHFVETLLNAIAAKPEHILCFQSNHNRSREAAAQGAHWYSTVDGFTMFGGTMPMSWWLEHREWRRNIKPDILVQNDEGVNLWAMATNRLIHKSLPSLVDHDTGMPSQDGNDHHAELSSRRSLVFAADADLRDRSWRGPTAELGRTYHGNHWRLITDLKEPLIEAAYTADRHGEPIFGLPTVCICTPCYGGVELGYLKSRDAAIADLVEHGYGITYLMSPGDSLVTRGRHCLMHQFLQTSATHMLFWDSDLELHEPEAVRSMVASKHRLVGGAYPFRHPGGGIVGNLRPEDKLANRVVTDDHGCMPALEIGTGFMLIERGLIVEMCEARMDLLYRADIAPFRGVPMWDLFGTQIKDQRYLSEDWSFCHHAQDRGVTPQIYLPATFKHWGLHGYETSAVEAFGMKPSTAKPDG